MMLLYINLLHPTNFVLIELADMADAAPAGDCGGSRGGFGDRGRQVKPKSVILKQNLYSFKVILFIVIFQGRQGPWRQWQGP